MDADTLIMDLDDYSFGSEDTMDENSPDMKYPIAYLINISKDSREIKRYPIYVGITRICRSVSNSTNPTQTLAETLLNSVGVHHTETIVIPDMSLSRNHAEIEVYMPDTFVTCAGRRIPSVNPQEIFITDLGSGNGTYLQSSLNYNRAAPPPRLVANRQCHLPFGKYIRFGAVVCLFVHNEVDEDLYAEYLKQANLDRYTETETETGTEKTIETETMATHERLQSDSKATQIISMTSTQLPSSITNTADVVDHHQNRTSVDVQTLCAAFNLSPDDTNSLSLSTQMRDEDENDKNDENNENDDTNSKTQAHRRATTMENSSTSTDTIPSSLFTNMNALGLASVASLAQEGHRQEHGPTGGEIDFAQSILLAREAIARLPPIIETNSLDPDETQSSFHSTSSLEIAPRLSNTSSVSSSSTASSSSSTSSTSVMNSFSSLALEEKPSVTNAETEIPCPPQEEREEEEKKEDWVKTSITTVAHTTNANGTISTIGMNTLLSCMNGLEVDGVVTQQQQQSLSGEFPQLSESTTNDVAKDIAITMVDETELVTKEPLQAPILIAPTETPQNPINELSFVRPDSHDSHDTSENENEIVHGRTIESDMEGSVDLGDTLALQTIGYCYDDIDSDPDSVDYLENDHAQDRTMDTPANSDIALHATKASSDIPSVGEGEIVPLSQDGHGTTKSQERGQGQGQEHATAVLESHGALPMSLLMVDTLPTQVQPYKAANADTAAFDSCGSTMPVQSYECDATMATMAVSVPFAFEEEDRDENDEENAGDTMGMCMDMDMELGTMDQNTMTQNTMSTLMVNPVYDSYEFMEYRETTTIEVSPDDIYHPGEKEFIAQQNALFQQQNVNQHACRDAALYDDNDKNDGVNGMNDDIQMHDVNDATPAPAPAPAALPFSIADLLSLNNPVGGVTDGLPPAAKAGMGITSNGGGICGVTAPSSVPTLSIKTEPLWDLSIAPPTHLDPLLLGLPTSTAKHAKPESLHGGKEMSAFIQDKDRNKSDDKNNHEISSLEDEDSLAALVSSPTPVDDSLSVLPDQEESVGHLNAIPTLIPPKTVTNNEKEQESVAPKTTSRRTHKRGHSQVEMEHVSDSTRPPTATLEPVEEVSTRPSKKPRRSADTSDKREKSSKDTLKPTASAPMMDIDPPNAEAVEAVSTVKNIFVLPSPPSFVIMSTGVAIDGFQESCEKLGATVVTEITDKLTPTHIIAGEVTRTLKFLIGVSISRYIVTVEWFTKSVEAGRFLPEQDYLLHDKEKERKWGFELQVALQKNKTQSGRGFLHGQNIVVVDRPDLRPGIAQLEQIIRTAGGHVFCLNEKNLAKTKSFAGFVLQCMVPYEGESQSNSSTADAKASSGRGATRGEKTTRGSKRGRKEEEEDENVDTTPEAVQTTEVVPAVEPTPENTLLVVTPTGLTKAQKKYLKAAGLLKSHSVELILTGCLRQDLDTECFMLDVFNP